MEQTKIIDELRKQATAVGAARQKQEEAHDAEKIASAELLDAVVDAVRPALHAMCNRVGAGQQDGQIELATFRALEIWGRLNDRILLSEHGDLIIQRRSNTPLCADWTSTFDLMTSRKVVDLIGDDQSVVIDRIGSALAAQASGASPKKTAKFNMKAERIRAAALLLRTA